MAKTRKYSKPKLSSAATAHKLSRTARTRLSIHTERLLPNHAIAEGHTTADSPIVATMLRYAGVVVAVLGAAAVVAQRIG